MGSNLLIQEIGGSHQDSKSKIFHKKLEEGLKTRRRSFIGYYAEMFQMKVLLSQGFFCLVISCISKARVLQSREKELSDIAELAKVIKDKTLGLDQEYKQNVCSNDAVIDSLHDSCIPLVRQLKKVPDIIKFFNGGDGLHKIPSKRDVGLNTRLIELRWRGDRFIKHFTCSMPVKFRIYLKPSKEPFCPRWFQSITFHKFIANVMDNILNGVKDLVGE